MAREGKLGIAELTKPKSGADSSERPSKDSMETEKPPIPAPGSMFDDGLDSFFLELDIDAAIAASKARATHLLTK